RGRAGRQLRRDRGEHRPAAAARAGRDHRRGGLPGLAAGPGDHRAVPGRQLRRVPPLSLGTAEELREPAPQATAPGDVGPDDYSDGLGELLDPYNREATPPP